MRVLLVDDSCTMRNIQKRILNALGNMQFAEAGDGVEALKILFSTPEAFDLVLIDWNMPNMDGHSLVQRIREKDKTTPLIMCTTEAEKARVIDAIKAGVNNYVIKPFTPEMLIERVTTTLSKLKAAA
ncbi:MAG: response regulator [Planctomycetota bacterium]|nr:response regulator [Planctomycetota bacterium]